MVFYAVYLFSWRKTVQDDNWGNDVLSINELEALCHYLFQPTFGSVIVHICFLCSLADMGNRRPEAD